MTSMEGQGVRTYADLPDAVVDFLSRLDAVEYADAFLVRYGVSNEKTPDVLALVEEIVLRKTALTDLPARLEALGVSKEKSQAAAADLARARLLPISSVVGDVAGVLTSWSGGAGAASVQTSSGMTPEAFVSLFLSDRPEAPKDPFLANRLRLILVSFAKGIRTKDQTLEALMRPSKVGGMAMDATTSKALVEATAQRMEMMGIGKELAPAPAPAPVMLQEDPFVDAPEEGKKPAPLSVVETDEEASGVQANDFDDDERELEVHSQKAQSVATAVPKGSVPDASAIADRVIAAAGLSFASDDLRKRFKSIVDARVSDVRDAFDTRALMEAPVDKGGMGIGNGPLATAMDALERLVAAHTSALTDKAAKDKAAMVQSRVARMNAAPATRSYAAAPSSSLAEPAKMAKGDEIVADAAMETSTRAPRIQAVPATASGRPRVVDIQGGDRRLAGPVDELSRLTLVEFRRLSRDPEEAARKLSGRIALLEEQGFDKKIAGIKAWRSSPLYRAYLALSEQSIVQGVGIEEIARRMKEEGTDTLTPMELSAVMKLNAELRF